jgi:hypothetical protein
MAERPEGKRRWDRDHRLIRSPNPKRLGMYGRITKAELDKMRKMRKAGAKVEEIAWEVGVHYSTVVRHTKGIK